MSLRKKLESAKNAFHRICTFIPITDLEKEIVKEAKRMLKELEESEYSMNKPKPREDKGIRIIKLS